MAQLPRGLWIALALWLATSGSSTASRTGSPDSVPWWATENFSSLQKTARRLHQAGDYGALEELYLRAIDSAQAAGNLRTQASYLTALGNTCVLRFRYAEAIGVYQKARDLAHASSDWLAEGAVASGLSSVYLAVGDWPAARESAREGLELTRRLATPPDYLAQLNLQNARLNPDAAESTGLVFQAIDAARIQSDVALEAEAWDVLGDQRMNAHDLEGAESALNEAYHLRILHVPQKVHHSFGRLGALRLAQNQLDDADRFTTAAIRFLEEEGAEPSSSSLLRQRGLILQARGNVPLALHAFEVAADRAERWRQEVPPSARSLAAADTLTDRSVLSTFIEASARLALSTKEAKWIEKSFLAAERNRAASLRQSAALAEVWHRKLPARYWQTLGQLRTELSRQVQMGGATERSQELDLELSEMEAAAGLGYSPNKPENFSPNFSLNLFKQGLRDSELFLSFYTGAEESYLWAVSRDSMHLYKLPSADRIGEKVRHFRSAVVQHTDPSAELDAKLYATLFGQLDKREAGRTDWILSLDGPLFELPVAALRNEAGYLVESHSLQITPSAVSLSRAVNSNNRGAFVGVGDPIYNWADERLHPVPSPVLLKAFRAPGQLNRLVASGEELERVAGTWKQPATLLRGSTASRAAFLQSLSAPPATVYLATHVVMAGTQGDRAFLAFSVGDGGSPELLGTADIAMLKVPGTLVVMTGCSSGAGDARPGAGLLGLTRAWLAAGASGVVASVWPVEDSRGELLSAFYRNIANHSSSISTAEALRRGQVEMIQSGTWQSDPAYWAAFQFTGDVR